MVADFAAPIAPTGWLELDGSVISTTTYSGLFAAMSITSSGTRTSGLTTVTGIPSTTGFKAGYYIFGTGISAGTTIASVDSAVQVTLSSPAGSSGTSAFFVSPWPMNTGTVTLPDVTTAGRYRRSRTSATKVGDLLADQNKAHTHAGTTANGGIAHTHSFSATTGAMNSNASHAHGYERANAGSASAGGGVGGLEAHTNTDSTNTDHTHNVSGTTGAASATDHTHTFTTASDGGTEVRPLSIVLMTCIKT